MQDIYSVSVKDGWIDYNGHMTDAAYGIVFSFALDKWMQHIGLDEQGRTELDYTIFTLENHIQYLHEAHVHELVNVQVQLLGIDEKRAHLFFAMYNAADTQLATSEQMVMGIDIIQRRPAPFPKKIAQKLTVQWTVDREKCIPKQVGKPIGIPKT